MDGYAKTLYWFQEEDLNIEVPFFQRPYVWDSENWDNLIDSIESADEGTLPFIGSFILQEKGKKSYWVIDGQQRITTLTVFVKCFLDVSKNIHPNTRTYLSGMIYKYEMVDSETYIAHPRLTPSNADKLAYEKVMDENLDSSRLERGDSSIVDCYLHFKDYLCKNVIIDKDKTKSLTDKLVTTSKYVVAIILNEKDDEQEIFDTVNSLGKRLTNSDIVKNYLFQKLKSYAGNNQTLIGEVMKYYEIYWNKVFIEGERKDFWDKEISLGRITTTNLNAFLKDYGTIMNIYAPSKGGGLDGLAKKYKEHIDKLDKQQLVDLLKDLAEYAELYCKMKKDYESCNDFRMSDDLNVTLLVLDKLELSTFNPYILKLLKGKPSDINEQLKSLQKYVIQRLLWKANTKGYNKVCLSLLNSDNPQQYLEQNNEQTIGISWDSFPITIRGINNGPANLLLFIIEMIRRHNNGEDNYSDNFIYNKTLEHIMPQKWEEHWSDVPSYAIDENKEFYVLSNKEDIKKHRNNKIYSLGNMTLLTSKLNTAISNSSFENKIQGGSNKGIKEFVGSLSIAQEIVDAYDNSPVWDERNIFEREKKLFDELNGYYKFVDSVKD